MSTAVSVAVAAAVGAVAAGSVVAYVARQQVRRAARAQGEAERDRLRLRHELDHLTRTFSETAFRVRALGAGRADELAADAFDPVSGLLRERFVAVLIQQRVAGARRRLHPVAVVALEADGVRGTDQGNIDRAMGALGGVIRETLREADCACRVGDVVVIAALDDTTDEGARLAIERVQASLRLATGDVGITVSAGIASYPTHALEAPDLVARAGEALLEARRAGTSRVATATAEAHPA